MFLYRNMGPTFAQVLAVLIGNLTMFSAGMNFGWPAPALPKLLETSSDDNDHDAVLRLTSDEGSWVVSICSFGCIFGPILSNLFVDVIGRKSSLILLVVPALVSWLIIGLATSVEVLYVGRFIGGLGIGGVFGVMPIYMTEIAEDRIRGAVGTLMIVMLNLGILMSFCICPWVSRQIFCVIAAIPPLLFIVMFWRMPESPYFLIMKGHREKAVASLVWLRRKTDVHKELSALEHVIMEKTNNKEEFGIMKLLRTSSYRKAFLISFGLLTAQQFSGSIAIQSYANLIFESSGLTGWSTISVIIVGIGKLVAAIGTTFVVDIAGRRPILIFSTIMASFFLMCEAVFFHVKDLGYKTSSFSWVPLVGVLGYDLVFMVGLGCVPYIMIGELFPVSVKATATMLLSTWGSTSQVIVAKAYEVIGTAIGIHWVFYGFAVFTVVSSFFVYFCVPETKKVSLNDIHHNLKT